MPQIKVRGIAPEELCKIDLPMVDKLTEIVGCPRDYFEIEYIQSVAIRNGKIDEVYPFIEVAWFDRGQEIQDQVAKTIYDFVQQIGIKNLDIAFIYFEKNNYYENGEHF
ncbi:DUF1904 domain-containing protein [Natronincola ferrireducens]|uniref:DUF1904 domain-containing protein n=1 Tax=Natronincola ferrireducens TaxID=393762 RepID=A0A1G9E9P3_9FIRM|nr:DUF1904 domain-containing protein [Natronincola ferrireducens]SDK72847.1 protein of unknown function [Natronincola ferrireducens]